MCPIETGGAKWEYSSNEKQELQEALDDLSTQTSKDLLGEHKTLTLQLQSANVVYMQGSGNQYLSDIQGLPGYPTTCSGHV